MTRFPVGWPFGSLLFDEARGEAANLSNITSGAQSVQLLWLLPLYEAEAELIRREGISAFDAR